MYGEVFTMKIQGISGKEYIFEGPYASTYLIDNRSGVYAIVDRFNGKYHLLDVGESHEVKNRLDNHDRKDCWLRKKNGVIEYCVYYTPDKQQSGRKEVEQDIRNNYQNLCGER